MTMNPAVSTEKKVNGVLTRAVSGGYTYSVPAASCGSSRYGSGLLPRRRSRSTAG